MCIYIYIYIDISANVRDLAPSSSQDVQNLCAQHAGVLLRWIVPDKTNYRTNVRDLTPQQYGPTAEQEIPGRRYEGRLAQDNRCVYIFYIGCIAGLKLSLVDWWAHKRMNIEKRYFSSWEEDGEAFWVWFWSRTTRGVFWKYWSKLDVKNMKIMDHMIHFQNTSNNVLFWNFSKPEMTAFAYLSIRRIKIL